MLSICALKTSLSTILRSFARQHLGGDIGETLRIHTQVDRLSDMRGQVFSIHIFHMPDRNVEVSVLDQREGVHCTCQLGIMPGGCDDGRRCFLLQERNDALVMLGIVKGEVLGHQLFGSQFTHNQQDLSPCFHSFQF